MMTKSFLVSVVLMLLVVFLIVLALGLSGVRLGDGQLSFVMAVGAVIGRKGADLLISNRLASSRSDAEGSKDSGAMTLTTVLNGAWSLVIDILIVWAVIWLFRSLF